MKQRVFINLTYSVLQQTFHNFEICLCIIFELSESEIKKNDLNVLP